VAYTVITRPAFELTVGTKAPQRIVFPDADAAIRYAVESQNAWTLYGTSKVERTELAPTFHTLLRITLVERETKARFWVEVRSDLPFRPGTDDLLTK
jgi:hypothetical protein